MVNVAKLNTSYDIIRRILQRAIFVRVLITTAALGLIWPNILSAASISESFPGDNSFPAGTLVSINREAPAAVELANLSNSQYLTGVVVDEGGSLLSINRDGETLHVATSGEVEIFISDVNGELSSGDFVGASWLSGVAMKAAPDTDQRLLGIALADFPAEGSTVAELRDIDTPSGAKDVKAGKLLVRLFDRDIATASGGQLTGIEQLAQKIAGKDVAYARVLMATGLFVVSAIISGVFLANAIRGSFISLGRNPLASESIFASLMQVSGVSIGLVIVGAFMAYLVLIL